jgi:hypothetical protein
MKIIIPTYPVQRGTASAAPEGRDLQAPSSAKTGGGEEYGIAIGARWRIILGRCACGSAPAYGRAVKTFGPDLFGGLKPTASTLLSPGLLPGGALHLLSFWDVGICGLPPFALLRMGHPAFGLRRLIT